MKKLLLLICLLIPVSASAQNVQDKKTLDYRSFYTNAEAKTMCEKCNKKVNNGKINESCSMCVGYFRGILSSVAEMNAMRQKADSRTVQICYKTDSIGMIIFHYIEYLTKNNVKIDGNSYNSFVEFLAKDYACETSVINDDGKKDVFFENIQKQIDGQ